MRRVISTLLAGGALLTAAACGTAPNSGTDTAASAPAAASPAATPAVGAACEALAQAYGKNMAPYAQSLTTLVSDRTTIAQAQQSLAAFATAVQDATKSSADKQLQADGKKTAEQMHAKSTDAKFFGAIKTPEDVNKAMGPTLTSWLSPLSEHCD
ncbi:hypothetical protein OHA21_51505 [Actinoplanes sp. NBC_00393]|uniref:hypothetical protein n=1 Tax=Actinoplanes sp. NBC_00393 TaxID=2975953 RepID=UPI002E1AF69F